jgi:hypothetical protein
VRACGQPGGGASDRGRGFHRSGLEGGFDSSPASSPVILALRSFTVRLSRLVRWVMVNAPSSEHDQDDAERGVGTRPPAV